MIFAALFFLLLGVAVIQLVMAIGPIRAILAADDRGIPTGTSDSTSTTRVMVVLCLRGDDPFLTSCLKALSDQEYPNFELRIVVDSEQDPAWDSIVESNVQDFRAVRIDVLRHSPTCCSLKNAALLQAIDDLDDSIDVVALVDADTIPHRTWLKDLVAPLGHSGIELTTGIRWYLPDQPSIGSISRLVWNAAATVQMIGMGIPWGGSLAISRMALTKMEVSKHWGHGLSEDTMLTNLLKRHGLRQRFVPSIIMINREDCSIVELLRWIKRQLVVAKLCHPSWPATVSHAFITAIVPLAGLFGLVGFVCVGNWTAVTWMALSLIGFQAAMYLFLVFGLWLVDRKLWNQRGQHPGLSWSILVRLPFGLILIQWLYPLAMISALRASTVDWRGMHYQIGEDGSICHEGHRPYHPPTNRQDRASL